MFRATLLSFLVMAFSATTSAAEHWAFFGTGADGIYVAEFNSETGEASEARQVAEIPRPNFLAIHPNQKFLYAAARQSESSGQRDVIAAFAIDPESGGLQLLNTLPTRGPGPCHVNVDATGQTLAVANYSGGSAETFTIGPDGKLAEPAAFVEHKGSSVNMERQDGPHAHSVNFSPDNRFLFVADLGLDKVFVYEVDPETGSLLPNDPPFAEVEPGSGPRHFSFHPSGRFAYVINELGSTVTVFAYDAEAGALHASQTISTLPAEGWPGENYTAEVLVHPSGIFLYGSNRGHDSIAVFEIDQETGQLKLVEATSTEGEWPRNFNFDPSGRYLLAENQNSDSVVVFSIDPQSGRLEATGETLTVPKPICVRFVSAAS